MDEDFLPFDFAEWADVKIKEPARVEEEWFRVKAEALYEAVAAVELKRRGSSNTDVETTLRNAFAGYESQHGNSFRPDYPRYQADWCSDTP